MRNITSIYGKSTDQPTSSAQEPSNYGEELAQRWCNSLFYGLSDAPGHGSYEHEGEYVDHAEREIVEPQAESSWAGLLRRWLFKRLSDTPGHGSHEHEDGYIDHAEREIAESQVESWENRSFNGQFDTPEYGSHEPEGRYTAVPQSPDPSEQRYSQEDTGTSLSDDCCIDHNQEHIYNTLHHDRTDHDIPSSSSYDSAVKSSDQIGTIDNVIQCKKAELQAFFSADKTERAFAEAKAVTIAYLERWKNKDDDICHFARIMLKNTDMDQYDLLDTLSQINEKLKELSKEYQKEYFERKMNIAQEYFEWAKIFRERFNIRNDRVEDWVQAGIKQQLGIELKDFRKSYQQSQMLIENFSPESYEKLVVANAKFKYIREILKWGIPVAGIPDYICGRKVTNVDGKGYNCLIRALLKGAHPGWEDELIEAGVEDMRRLLEEDNLVKEGAMLDLGSEEGKQLINRVKMANWIEPDREILVYQYRGNKIQCFSITDGTSDKPPYAVLRDHDGEHFRAIELPE